MCFFSSMRLIPARCGFNVHGVGTKGTDHDTFDMGVDIPGLRPCRTWGLMETLQGFLDSMFRYIPERSTGSTVLSCRGKHAVNGLVVKPHENLRVNPSRNRAYRKLSGSGISAKPGIAIDLHRIGFEICFKNQPSPVMYLIRNLYAQFYSMPLWTRASFRR